MHYTLLQFLILLSEAVLLIILAQKVKISCSIFLVLAGLGIGYIPGIPALSIDPEVIFQIFLLALLYEAACYTLSNDFRCWQRPINLLRFRTGDHHLIGCRFFKFLHDPWFYTGHGLFAGPAWPLRTCCILSTGFNHAKLQSE